MSTTLRWDAVLFDLDGTLMDTNELIMQSFEHVFRVTGYPAWTREEMIPYMGTPLWDQLRVYTGQQEVDDLVEIYREYNLRHHDELIAPFPGMVELIRKLRAAGVRLGIVTTKSKVTAGLGLRMYEVFDDFEVLVAIEDVAHAKPHPEPIEKALQVIQVPKDRVVMVGDSPADLDCARNAGIASVAVKWSLKSEEELSRHDPTFWIETLQELEKLCGI
jgi:pyrophosphatase PpaX